MCWSDEYSLKLFDSALSVSGRFLGNLIVQRIRPARCFSRRILILTYILGSAGFLPSCLEREHAHFKNKVGFHSEMPFVINASEAGKLRGASV